HGRWRCRSLLRGAAFGGRGVEPRTLVTLTPRGALVRERAGSRAPALPVASRWRLSGYRVLLEFIAWVRVFELRDQADRSRTPALCDARFELFADPLKDLVESLLADGLVEHAVLCVRHPGTREAVRAVLAVDAQHQVARTLALSAVFEVRAALARQT